MLAKIGIQKLNNFCTSVIPSTYLCGTIELVLLALWVELKSTKLEFP